MVQGRRARLVIRRVEPLTVLKVAVLFWASVYVILLVAALMLWSAATATGLRENVESFVGDLIAADDFKFQAGQILRASVAGAAVLVALGSFATVMMAVLYNLIADVVGGVAVILEETGRRAGRAGDRRATRTTGNARGSLGKKIGSKIGPAASTTTAAATTKVAAPKDKAASKDDESPSRSGTEPERTSPGQR